MQHEVCGSDSAWERAPGRLVSCSSKISWGLSWIPGEGPHPPPANLPDPRHTNRQICGGLAQLLERRRGFIGDMRIRGLRR